MPKQHAVQSQNNIKNNDDKPYIVINPQPEHFSAIQDLCKEVYPFVKPWSIAQLEAHHSYFPEGQFIAIEKDTEKVVGLAFSLIIAWDDYSNRDNWQDFTSAGFFHNHNPRKGKTLYGAEVMVDPQYRGRGIAKQLYQARRDLAQGLNLKRIRAGARLRGYSKFKDTLTAQQYTQQVVENKIFDPTLSFQLNQGFVVIDVAKNYLSNDPESLGYAAVIEWLNPLATTDKELKRQTASVRAFMENQKLEIDHLPRELRRLVRKMTLLLGSVIKEYEGDKFYNRVESYRQSLKKSRFSSDPEILAGIASKLLMESPGDQYKVAHGFALLLEIINVCESSYRTWRQRQKTQLQSISSRTELNFVLTAHPTEARSENVVEVLRRLTNLLVEGLNHNFSFNEPEILSQFRLLWLNPLVKTQAPTVLDEANYIYSIVFSKSIFDFLIREKDSYNLRLRTWVGGDKDGHPGVDERAMQSSLSGSRRFLIKILSEKLELVVVDLEKLNEDSRRAEEESHKIKKLITDLKPLYSLGSRDGQKLSNWEKTYQSFLKKASLFVVNHHQTLLIRRIFELFPALVLPLELREDSEEIGQALQNPQAPLSRMLSKIVMISKGSDLTGYVRGLVISHCEGAADIDNANRLAQKICKTRAIPIIPLFETKAALTSSKSILSDWLKVKTNLDQVSNVWDGKLEVMLGYSDSSKQIGVLPSRYLIRNSMYEIESALRHYKVRPVFFHGSGGSVARGGGSLREQISWWPNSAIQLPKLTVQGEMIQRTFATKEILNSQCLHLSHEAHLRRNKRVKLENPPVLNSFVSIVQDHYTKFVSNPDLLGKTLDATPYHYLNVLRIGSRPSKRASGSAGVSLNHLRAIPWVLCWTQTRLLLPSWWGIGSAWDQMSKSEKQELKNLYQSDAFFSSFVKTLGFTLAKVELKVWDHYLQAKYDQKAKDMSQPFKEEYKKAVSFVRYITESKHLIAHKPWLEESIKLRSPYVHILNLLQIQAMEKHQEKLLKETLVGIACGMLTTG